MEPLSQAAEAGVHLLALPTPFAVGRVNCWLIEDDPLTLLDTGPNSGEALDLLERGLAEHGHRVEDLGLVVVSHQHMDHLGLVEILARRSGAEVAAFAPLAPWLAEFGESMEADDEFSTRLMAEHGIPGDVRLALRAVSGAFRGWGGRADVTAPLADGDELRMRDRTLRVLHRPGHSPSDLVLHDAERRLLLGADHLLGHISSNPLLTRPLGEGPDAPRPHALETYLRSLGRTAAMEDVDVVLPGHGDPVTDAAGLVAERLVAHERRAAKIHRLLADGPRTAHELAQAMWGGVAVTQAFLTLSEVLGHLDLLVRDGRAVEGREDGVVRYAQA